jgi:hypothetical protein
MSEHMEIEPVGELEPELAELADQITRRLLDGEVISDDARVGSNPACDDPIRRLLPALRTLVAVGQKVARDRRHENDQIVSGSEK